MIKTLIVEDEKNNLQVLERMIAHLQTDIEVIGHAEDPNTAIELIESLSPDLIFLDIHLKKTQAEHLNDGFAILKAFPQPTFKVIFTTAYERYAIQAFRYNALDYLLKPIDPLELQEAINRVKNTMDTKDDFRALVQPFFDKIVLKTSDQRFVVALEDIIRLEGEGAYTHFHLKDGKKIMVSKNLKYYEDLLPDTFVRCHQSHLVHTDAIIRLDTPNNLLHLNNGDAVPVSRRKKNSLISLMKKNRL